MLFWRRRWDPARIYPLPVGKILSNPHQPRRRVDPEALEALARSIRENGVLVPILVRPTSGGRKFELVAGQRRLAACRKLGLPTIPGLVREMGEEEIVRLGLLENLHRANLSEVEEGGALRSLAVDFEGMTPADAARRLGLDPEEAERRLKWLELPMLIQEALIAGFITPEHAETMREVRDAERQLEILKRVRRDGWTPAQVRQWIDAGAAPSPSLPAASAAPSLPSSGGLAGLVREAEGLFEAVGRGGEGTAGDVERLTGAIAREVRRDPVAALSWIPAFPGFQTAPHAIRTAAHVLFMAGKLALSEKEARLLGAASLVSDAGMVRIPRELLDKRGALTEPEREVVRRHVLEIRETLFSAGLDRRSIRIVEQHHERFDGTGYPASARGPAIDPLALWVGVMDMYTALAEPRAWRPALPPRKAVQQVLLSGHRGIFPKHLLRDFIHTLGLYPVGSRVRLKSGGRGVVARANPEAVQKPVVQLESGSVVDLAASDDEILSEI